MVLSTTYLRMRKMYPKNQIDEWKDLIDYQYNVNKQLNTNDSP